MAGGHFNPTFKTAPFTPGAPQDSFEVGDFSGKHRLLILAPALSLALALALTLTTNLTLTPASP